MPSPWGIFGNGMPGPPGPPGPAGPPGPGEAGGVQTIDFTIGTGTVDSVTSIPNTAIVYNAWITITTPYSGGATLELGSAATPTLLQGTSDNNPQVDNIYALEQRTPWPIAGAVRCTVGGAPGVGAGKVTIQYSGPPNP